MHWAERRASESWSQDSSMVCGTVSISCMVEGRGKRKGSEEGEEWEGEEEYE